MLTCLASPDRSDVSVLLLATGLIAWILSVGFMLQTAKEQKGCAGALGCILLPPVFYWFVWKEWPWTRFLGALYTGGLAALVSGLLLRP